MSRRRTPTPLPDGTPEAVRILLTELRALKEESGLDLRALERRTHASRSSWGRWLSGETWIPADAVTSLADLCGADARRLSVLWEVADEARRSAPAAAESASENRPVSPSETPAATAPDEPNHAESTDRAEPAEHAEPDRAELVGVPGVGGELGPAEPGAGELSGGGRTRSRRLLFLGAVAGCTLVAGSAGVALGAALQTPPVAGAARERPSGTARPAAKGISRHEVLVRAQAWHPHGAKRVPYDQNAGYHGYRTDGSGYASMALGLPKPGPNSALLEASYCRRIPMASLLPGDLVIKASGGADVREVLVFEQWTGPDRRAYWAYQQRRGYGTDHLVRRDGLASGSDHHGCRPLNVQDDPVG
ncbi:helix-turn-helix transcriptional regulator [Actinomadura sp. K4S16]|uniref:helix-turn-helix domain-containing protein n=1 Tax=Actinomadura sp. K4S16 TaxID=1316147 RepID=UPI00135707A8|nr:helix-turn-helix transcriptional regulator [Actinomadura sp. K4S16]